MKNNHKKKKMKFTSVKSWISLSDMISVWSDFGQWRDAEINVLRKFLCKFKYYRTKDEIDFEIWISNFLLLIMSNERDLQSVV